MRVIAGKYKSIKLNQVPVKSTRQTSDKIRGACFNMLGNITDLIVLDLFSGSGAYGIEAISRNAKKAYLVDNNKQAIKTIYENIDKIKIKDKTDVNLNDAIKFLKTNKIKFDIVFLDPPYNVDIIDILNELKNHLNEDFKIVYEHNKEFSYDYNYYEILKQKKYGNKYLTFIIKNKSNYGN